MLGHTMEMPIDQAMAGRLRHARALAKYETASEAARAMRINQQTYLGHENGNGGFIRSAARYAAFFKVDYKWLVTGIGSARGPSIEAEILSLNPDEQRQVNEFVEFLKNRGKKHG